MEEPDENNPRTWQTTQPGDEPIDAQLLAQGLARLVLEFRADQSRDVRASDQVIAF